MVVDVAEPVRERLGDLRKLPSREPRDGVPLRQHDAAQRRDVALVVEDALHDRGFRPLEHFLLEHVEACRELVDLGPVVVDERVDDAIEERRGALAEHAFVARTDVRNAPNGARRPRVERHEILRAEEEINLLRPEGVLARLEVDGVQDQIEVVAVGFDLRMVDLGEGVLDREFVELEHLAEHLRFLQAWQRSG